MVRGVLLGAEYTDTVSRVKGVAISLTSYVTGCDRVCLEYVKADGERAAWHTDVLRLVDAEGICPAAPPPSGGVTG